MIYLFKGTFKDNYQIYITFQFNTDLAMPAGLKQKM